jgi:putative flavoprotein involved in K+ transport
MLHSKEATLNLPHETEIVIIGAGQAGLSMSWHLKDRGLAHVVLDRNGPAHAWRNERWDSFCLVTPNWQCQLPGFPYQGNDPNGFMLKDDIVAYLEAYIRSFEPPLFNHVTVERVTRSAGGTFTIETDAGVIRARQVVVATGGYHDPILLPASRALPDGIVQLDAAEYRNPDALPPGAVLVVGSGQSGCQIAEDLHLAGRRTHLAVGEAPRVARRYRGKDVVEWLHLMGFYDMPVDEHPLREGVRDNTNHYVTGRDGGRDIDLRLHATTGLSLYGRLVGVSGMEVRFDSDLAKNLDHADKSNEAIKRSIDAWIAKNAIDAPEEDPYRPMWQPAADHPVALDLATSGIRTVIWCVGYRMNYGWLDMPALFDEKSRPRHVRGVTPIEGLYFLGLPWLHTWGSGRMSGVGRDAAYLANEIATFAAVPETESV